MNLDTIFNDVKHTVTQKLTYGLSEVLANKFHLNKQEVQKEITRWLTNTPVEYTKVEPPKPMLNDLESELTSILERENIIKPQEKVNNSTEIEKVAQTEENEPQSKKEEPQKKVAKKKDEEDKPKTKSKKIEDEDKPKKVTKKKDEEDKPKKDTKKRDEEEKPKTTKTKKIDEEKPKKVVKKAVKKSEESVKTKKQ